MVATQKLSREQRCLQTKQRNLARRKDRREDAEERQKHWASLSYSDQLKQLDSRLGKGVGAVKQRKRIMEKMK